MFTLCTCLVNIARTFLQNNVAINMKENTCPTQEEKNNQPKIYQCCITFYGGTCFFKYYFTKSKGGARILNVHSAQSSLLQDLCGLTSVTYYTHIYTHPCPWKTSL